MSKLSIYPPKLTGESISDKREEIKSYFLNTYELFEKIFEILKDDSVFYKKSEPTRHPMVFYFGHTATFYINKLILMNIITKRINPEFESIFAVGVDEMSWDDIESSHYNWPSIDEIRVYRAKVKEVVLNLIDTLEFKLPINFDSSMWIILMGIEHERIHIETSSVLHRQMPLEFIKKVDDFVELNEIGVAPINEMISIPACNVKLGKDVNDGYYGWDNEYGKYEEKLQTFKVSKYLVSNQEYLEFVESGGYKQKEFWSEEGLKFLEISCANYPVFWIKDNCEYFYRTMSSKIKMPWNFPVDVNALEAEAFCNYISKRDGVKYILPSEAEYEAMCIKTGVDSMLKEDDANINFKLASSCPVDRYEFNGIYDVVGNVWQWSRTPIRPFDGFKVHPAYDDFTVPTYDEKHALILGSSWASSGNLIMKKSRYAFRRHFYQHAGFRYVISQNESINEEEIYESDEVVSEYCELQYSNKNLEYMSFITECVNIISKYVNKTNKALDLGCKTGRMTFELAKIFDEVQGVDFSARFISVGSRLKDGCYVAWKTNANNDIYTNKISLEDLGCEHLSEKVSFWQGDASNLKPNYTGYDLIVITDIIDEYKDPYSFMDNMSKRLNKNGIIILINSSQLDNQILDTIFELKDTKELEYKAYKVSVWQKK